MLFKIVFCQVSNRLMANAAPEWQAMSLGWQSIELVVACPLKGLVGRCTTSPVH